MNQTVYYWDYLQLDKILSSQQLLSEQDPSGLQHEEMLFVITHQGHELWFKQWLTELESICSIFNNTIVPDKDVLTIAERLLRIHEIQKVLLQHLQVLKTMTPMVFLDFRQLLTPASGLQSVQFRCLECRLGCVSEQKLRDSQAFKVLQSSHQQQLLAAVQKPSLWHLVENWLARMPFLEIKGYNFWSDYQQAVEQHLAKQEHQLQATLSDERELMIARRQITEDRQHFDALFSESHYLEEIAAGRCSLSYDAVKAALFIFLYRDQPILQLPYQLLSSLLKMDELLAQWRYTHLSLVQRMIGKRMGTGGSQGYAYLKDRVEATRLFADLESLATWMLPSASIPVLPVLLLEQLQFLHKVDVHDSAD